MSRQWGVRLRMPSFLDWVAQETGYSTPAFWNDEKGRTQGEVLDLLGGYIHHLEVVA